MDTDKHKHFGDLNSSTEDSKSMNKYVFGKMHE